MVCTCCARRDALPADAGSHDTAYFLATKLEAFDGRGGGDFLASHDIEDVVSVIDGRPTLPAEVAEADAPLNRYLAARCNALLETPDFVAAICRAPASGCHESTTRATRCPAYSRSD